MASLRVGANAIGIKMEPLSEALFQKSLSGSDRSYSDAVKSLEAHGMSGSMTDLLSILDRMTHAMQGKERAAVDGGHSLVQANFITDLGTVLGTIGAIVGSAAALVGAFGASGAVVVAGIGAGAMLGIVGGVGVLLGMWVDDNPGAFLDMVA